MIPSCDQVGTPGLVAFTHLISSTTPGSASLMSPRILLSVSPRQSASSWIRLSTWSDAESLIAPSGSSFHRFLQEGGDLRLLGLGQLLQRERGRPHGALVEVRLVAEAERRVARLELLRALEEADDLAVLRVRGHPVPGLRLEVGRARLDDGVDPLRHRAIGPLHLGDLREQLAFPGLPVRSAARLSLQLPGPLPHRGLLVVREGRPLGGPLLPLGHALK